MKEIIFPKIEKINGPPVIQKNGITCPEAGEMSLFVHKGRLKYLVNGLKSEDNNSGSVWTGDYITRQEYARFGGEGSFYQAYCENDIVYVFSTKDNHVIRYVSRDLEHWTDGEIVLTFPEEFKLYNTAVCKGDEGYVMAVECSGLWDEAGNILPNEHVGVPFTVFFAKSGDFENWEIQPYEKSGVTSRYNGGPALEYSEGYYYLTTVEELPACRYTNYIYRSKDLETWEVGFYNPLLMPSREDLTPKPGVELSQELLEVNFKHLNTNNSDVDYCEFEGKTYMLYCSGNQGNTWGGMYCEAVYDGTLAEFFKANFS